MFIKILYILTSFISPAYLLRAFSEVKISSYRIKRIQSSVWKHEFSLWSQRMFVRLSIHASPSFLKKALFFCWSHGGGVVLVAKVVWYWSSWENRKRQRKNKYCPLSEIHAITSASVRSFKHRFNAENQVRIRFE